MFTCCCTGAAEEPSGYPRDSYGASLWPWQCDTVHFAGAPSNGCNCSGCHNQTGIQLCRPSLAWPANHGDWLVCSATTMHRHSRQRAFRGLQMTRHCHPPVCFWDEPLQVMATTHQSNPTTMTATQSQTPTTTTATTPGATPKSTASLATAWPQACACCATPATSPPEATPHASHAALQPRQRAS